MSLAGPKPIWLTFDCYGTLAQWDEGLNAAVSEILAKRGGQAIDPDQLVEIYDKYEHALEQERPFRNFRDVAGTALARALDELGLENGPSDIEILTGGISNMPPFPEVPETLASLKNAGFKLCVVSNTDDDIIQGNVAQMAIDGENPIDRVITAQQAQAYKPSRQIFEHAHEALGVTFDEVVHICASPHLDLVAARDMGFRAVWINRGTGRKPLPGYRPDGELPDLAKVLDLFEETGWM